MSRRSLALALAATTLSPLFARDASAGGFHISILGARRSGMLTNLADPDDLTALFANPAGLADQKGTRLLLSSGISVLDSSFRLQALDPLRFPEINGDCDPKAQGSVCPWPIGQDGYYTRSINPERAMGVIPYLGISQSLGALSKSLEDVTISAAAYAPGAYGAFMPENAPTAYYVLNGLFVIGAATAGFGWRVNDVVSVGASLSYNYRRLQFAEKFSLSDVLTPAGQTPDLTAGVAEGTVGDLRLEYTGVDHGLGWGLGVLVTPTDWLSLGAAYQGFTNAHFEGDVALTGLGSRITGTSPLDAADLRQTVSGFGYKLPRSLTVEMVIPPQLAGGVAIKPSRYLQLGLDLRWWLYSIFEREILDPHYDAGEGKEPLSRDSLSKSKNYHDSFEVSLGVLARPWAPDLDLDLMAGVGFDRSPVPDRTFSIDNPSMDQVVLSVGSRLGLGEHWRLGLSYMLLIYVPRDIKDSTTSPATNAKISGLNHIPTLEAGYVF